MFLKRLLKDKKGVTLLESLIALLLLAIVATGSFAVLLSTSRKSLGPDIREEMALAIEKASDLLQGAVMSWDTTNVAGYTNFNQGPCGDDPTPFSTSGEHSITCLLPPICDRNPNRSHFFYKVDVKTSPAEEKLKVYSNNDYSERLMNTPSDSDLNDGYTTGIVNTTLSKKLFQIEFDIECNGFTL